jgi:hypothetical protein
VTDNAAAAAETSISKAAFAARRGVTPGRVSQWIAEKKIRPPAFDGEGRSAKIFESIALGQLNRTIDIHQRLGNGAGTNLSAPPPAASAPIAGAAEVEAGASDNVIAFEARPPAPGRPPPPTKSARRSAASNLKNCNVATGSIGSRKRSTPAAWSTPARSKSPTENWRAN